MMPPGAAPTFLRRAGTSILWAVRTFSPSTVNPLPMTLIVPGPTEPADPPVWPPPPTDAALIARSRRDPEAFAAVFDRHWATIHGFCKARAGSAGEDIAAEVFRTAFHRRGDYDVAHADARPWLYGIATNRLREHFRGAQRRDRALARAGTAAARAEGGEDRSGGWRRGCSAQNWRPRSARCRPSTATRCCSWPGRS